MAKVDHDKIKLLHGPYRMPRCRVGSKLTCEIRGDVKVTRISDARIPWPMTHGRKQKGGHPALIVCGDLAKAIKRESAIAIGYWFGPSPSNVWKLRKALDVPRYNEGTKRLYRDHVFPVVREATAGRPLNIEHRRKLSAVRRQLKMRPPKAGRPWKRSEDRLLGKMPDKEVAARTGRTVWAVETRRQLLRIPSARGKGMPMLPETALMKKVALLRR